MKTLDRIITSCWAVAGLTMLLFACLLASGDLPLRWTWVFAPLLLPTTATALVITSAIGISLLIRLARWVDRVDRQRRREDRKHPPTVRTGPRRRSRR